ncbi:hypothetical protein J6G99_08390 [bacterium]|nr:hypothetical protein [bacterium]
MSFKINVMIKFPPLIPPKFPEKYIIYTQRRYSSFNSKIADIKTGELVGEMSTYIPVSQSVFYISKLLSFRRNQGIGTIFVNLAKKMCEEYVGKKPLYVLASSMYDKKNPPFLFYKKMGFEPMDCPEHILKHLNECIKEHKQVDTNIINEDIFMIYKGNK